MKIILFISIIASSVAALVGLSLWFGYWLGWKDAKRYCGRCGSPSPERRP